MRAVRQRPGGDPACEWRIMSTKIAFWGGDGDGDGVTRVDMGAYEYGSVSFRRGDLNCDVWFDGADIWPFFVALGDPDEFAAECPNCNINNGDINADGAVDGADIQPFFDLLSGGG